MDLPNLPGEVPQPLPRSLAGSSSAYGGSRTVVAGQTPDPLPRGGARGTGEATSPPPPVRSTGEVARAGSCLRTPNGRALPGRHLDGCDGTGCEGCVPCPEPHCRTCRREHAADTCPTCRAVARLNLAMIGELAGHLPVQASFGRQAWHVHDGLLGGDATVMLTPASPHWPDGWTRPVTSELPGDVRPPLDVLAHWVNRWAPVPVASVDDAVALLATRLHQIAATELFPPMARDLARVLHELENVLHAGDRPEISRVPCWDCGTRLHVGYAADPDHDYWYCPVCGQTFDHQRYVACRHYQLSSRGADRYVPFADAVAVTGRPETTVRSWITDGRVHTQRNASGRLEVWWPDVRELHRITPTRRRVPR